MNRLKRARTLRYCLCFAAGITVAAAGQQPKPTFKTGVEAVTLDVSVLDKERHPVRGLTAADFTILEDGQPQKIQTFSAIDFPEVVETTAVWTRTVAPDVRRNDDYNDRRLITIVLDDDTLVVVECGARGLSPGGWPKFGGALDNGCHAPAFGQK